jgi:hypothetical protein
MSRLGWTLGSWHRRVVPQAPVWLSLPRASNSSTSDSTVGQMRCAPDPLVRITGEADLAQATILSLDTESAHEGSQLAIERPGLGPLTPSPVCGLHL